MKSFFLLFFICCIGAACKKEFASSEQKASSAQNLNAVFDKAQPEQSSFGVLPNGMSTDDEISVAQELGVTYVRDAITLKDFDGDSKSVDEFISNGFNVLLNLDYVSEKIVNGDKKPHPFPTDMKQYKQLLKSVLDVYTPEVAVIENEPFNDNHYSGPITDYFTELTTAISVCHARGIKVADGGLDAQRVSELVYQNYVAEGKQKKADDFASRALIDKNLRVAQGKASADAEAKLDETRQMVETYATMDLDYVNLHWYEPIKDDIDSTVTSPGVLQEIADYLTSTTGHPVLTNEFGQNNQIKTLVSSQVDAFKSAGFKYAVDWSGYGASGAKPLTDGTKLLSNGRSYRDEIPLQ